MTQVIYVDVDDTLVRSVGSKRIPMTLVVQRIVEMKRQGATLYLWSTGGADYAQASAEELGIAEIFSGFLPKPHVMIDDQPVHEWRDCRHEYPLG